MKLRISLFPRLCTVLLLIFALTASVGAETLPDVKDAEGSCGDHLNWVISDDTLTIYGTGDMDNWSADCFAPWAPYPFDRIVIENGVTSVGDYAFTRSQITSVTLPDTVTSIGASAFFGCELLTDLTLPEGLTSLGEKAFFDCKQLTSLTLPAALTDLGDGALSGWTNISEFHVSPENPAFCALDGALYSADMTTLIRLPISFSGEYQAPETLTTIGSHACYRCLDLTAFTMPQTVTSIGDHAFAFCLHMNSVNLPTGLTGLGDSAFSHCSELKTLNLPMELTFIGASAFENCEGLTSVTIPSHVSTIGPDAFFNCWQLTGLRVMPKNADFYDRDGLLFPVDRGSRPDRSTISVAVPK